MDTEAIPLNQQQCSNCRFFKRFEERRGSCRKHAPTITQDGYRELPRVAIDDMCGDWQDEPPGRGSLPVDPWLPDTSEIVL